jgi:hypothetical protein
VSGYLTVKKSGSSQENAVTVHWIFTLSFARHEQENSHWAAQTTSVFE